MSRRLKLVPIERIDLCANCRYWQEVQTQKAEVRRGRCRRFPDVVLAVDEDGNTLQVRPIMNADEWCGEYSARPEAFN